MADLGQRGIGLTDEHEELGASVRGFARRHVTSEVVRAALGAQRPERPPFWPALAEQGLTGLHLAEEHGGQGAGLLEVCVVLERLAAASAPGPYLPTVLAGALIQASGSAKAAAQLLPGLADGSRTGAAALTSGLTGRRENGQLVVGGSCEPVLGAGYADIVVAPVDTPEGEVWVALEAADLTVTDLTSVDLLRPVAAIAAGEVTVPDDRVLDGLDRTAARARAAVLLGAEAAGVAAWCVTAAAEYAKVREQFGRPIGQFQGVKHLCAQMLTELERARAVVWDAARALDDPRLDPAAAELTAAIAAVVAPEAAVRCAADCIQVHGGIGYTWEHDAHLYYRRALTLRALLGSAGPWARRVAELAVAGARREVTVDLGADAEPIRERIRSELAGIAALGQDERRAALGDGGWSQPHLPPPYGRGAGPLEQVVIAEELRAARLRPAPLIIGAWVVPSLVQYGTEEQKRRFLPPTLRGELMWCQLFSEPGAGSDLAGLSMKARRVPGGFELTGQKIWTSLAHVAAWGICLARTNDEAPKHDGLTYFLVDMKSAGLTVRPLREANGDNLFNEVFFDSVFVPDDLVVGAVDDGWRVARHTMSNERVSLSTSASQGLGVAELLAAVGRLGRALDDPELERVGALVAQEQAIALLALRTTLKQLSGTEPGAESSVRKLLAMHHAQHIAEAGWELLGAGGAVERAEPGAPGWAKSVISTRAMTIYGGTTQVQLNIIAERMLGLPRDA